MSQPLQPGMATSVPVQSAGATRVKLSDGRDIFKRLQENKTVLHLLCSLDHVAELARLLHGVSKQDAALALAQVRLHWQSVTLSASVGWRRSPLPAERQRRSHPPILLHERCCCSRSAAGRRARRLRRHRRDAPPMQNVRDVL